MDIKKEIENIYKMNFATIQNLNKNFITIDEAKITLDLINQRLEIFKLLSQIP